jgi:Mrp family chromosome partitioning ATPase
MQELQGSNAVIARPAEGAAQIAPRPKRAGLIGLALGLILGLGLAFLRDALDTRVRAAEDVAVRLGLPLLARIPEPPRKLQRAEELVLFKEPTSVRSEAFRMLRTNMEFAGLDHEARSIMITSGLEEEGKSTTVANLAVAVARTGRRVALVDLDLRRPYLDRFFKVEGKVGLTNVVLGYARLEDATARVAIPETERAKPGEGNGHSPVGGFLDVLPAGPLPPNVGEFVGTAEVARILKELGQRYDLVLVDTPPMLHVGDALTLASQVDALILIARLPAVRRPILNELKRVLDNSPGAKLGFALAGAHLEEGYGYEYGYYYSPDRSRKGGRAREREHIT